jgi:hypothetical protein
MRAFAGHAEVSPPRPGDPLDRKAEAALVQGPVEAGFAALPQRVVLVGLEVLVEIGSGLLEVFNGVVRRRRVARADPDVVPGAGRILDAAEPQQILLLLPGKEVAGIIGPGPFGGAQQAQQTQDVQELPLHALLPSPPALPSAHTTSQMEVTYIGLV